MSDARIYPGPWTKQVRQPLGGSRWFVRLDDGRLAVLCRWDKVHIAPVPPAVAKRPFVGNPDPGRITTALDYAGVFGPEVDEALGVATDDDHVVDAWEAGTLVPTSEQVCRLARLTGMLPEWFYLGPLPQIDGFSSIDLHSGLAAHEHDAACPHCGGPLGAPSDSDSV